MACLISQYTPATGPVLPVRIAAPGGSFLEYSALLDSGATGTSVSAAVVRDLQLHSLRPVVLRGATGLVIAGRYLVDFELGHNPPVLTISGLLTTLFFSSDADAYEVILGRDVLCRGHFSMSLDGRFLFCI